MKPIEITTSEVADGKVHVTALFGPEEVSGVYKMINRMLAYQCNIDSMSDEDLPRLIVERMGQQGLNDTYAEAVPTMLTPFVLCSLDFQTIMSPRMVDCEIPHIGSNYEFTIEVTPKPKFELTSYDPVVIKTPKPLLPEEEVDGFIASMADEVAEYVTSEPGYKAQPGDRVIIDIETWREFGPVHYLTKKDTVVELGVGWLTPEFDETVIGMKEGEKKTFKFKALGEASKDENDTEVLTSKVIIKEILTRVDAEITDEWVAANIPECNTIEELRQMVQERMFEQDTTPEDEQVKLAAVAAKLAERFDGTITDAMYEDFLNEQLAQMDQQAAAKNKSFDEYLADMGLSMDNLGEYLMDMANTQLRQGFALDAYYNHFGLSINKQDIDDAIANMIGVDYEEAIEGQREQFELAGRMYILDELAMRLKANKHALARAIFEQE